MQFNEIFLKNFVKFFHGIFKKNSWNWFHGKNHGAIIHFIFCSFQQQAVNMKRREVFPFKIIVALSMQQLIFCFKVHYLLQLLNLKVLSVTDSSGKKISAWWNLLVKICQNLKHFTGNFNQALNYFFLRIFGIKKIYLFYIKKTW